MSSATTSDPSASSRTAPPADEDGKEQHDRPDSEEVVDDVPDRVEPAGKAGEE